MNDLLYVTVDMHFEVIDSVMYGGVGSIGYTFQSFGGVGNLAAVNDEFIDQVMKTLAATLRVPVENVRLISKEEYDQGTEAPDCECGY